MRKYYCVMAIVCWLAEKWVHLMITTTLVSATLANPDGVGISDTVTQSTTAPSHQLEIISAILVGLILIWAIFVIICCVLMIRITRYQASVHPKSDNSISIVDNIEEPIIEEFPSDTYVVEGESILLKVAARGKPEPILQWYYRPCLDQDNGLPVRRSNHTDINKNDTSVTVAVEYHEVQRQGGEVVKHPQRFGGPLQTIEEQPSAKEMEISEEVEGEEENPGLRLNEERESVIGEIVEREDKEETINDELIRDHKEMEDRVSTKDDDDTPVDDEVKILGSDQEEDISEDEDEDLGNSREQMEEMRKYSSATMKRHASVWETENNLRKISDTQSPQYDDDQCNESQRVPIDKFKYYVAYNHSNSNAGFKILFSNIYKGNELPASVGRINEDLNRHKKITVYDHNRIILHPIPGEIQYNKESYINACYIKGYLQPRHFIATQGPMRETLVDFWWMVWQDRPSTIVMLTKLKEGTCTQYWPNEGQRNFGIFIVTITDCQIYCDYCVRTLLVTIRGRTNKPLEVKHYQFTSWPRSNKPDYSTLVLFYRTITSQHESSLKPILVHCSAGVGRTGIFICISNVVEQIKEENITDIHGVISKMRHQHMMMVQNLEQYIYIHDVILEYITYGDTQINAADLRSKMPELCSKENSPTILEKQHEVLKDIPVKMLCLTAIENFSKNRLNSYLPLDAYLVNSSEDDYIHAVFVKGYKSKREFIIAEGPMQSTSRNMWKAIFDQRCGVIVMLSQLEESGVESSYQYWPTSKKPIEFGEYKIELIEENWKDDLITRSLTVCDCDQQLTHPIMQFHITCWKPHGKWSNLKSVINVINEVTEVQKKTKNRPIFVHCSDTVTRSSMFCAITNSITRYKTEGVVDIFQTVKALRIYKPGAVPSVDNYQMIHDAVNEYIKTYSTQSSV